ncbi:MAG: hypothetical protein AAF430_00440 [Myxococcota bacterium]
MYDAQGNGRRGSVDLRAVATFWSIAAVLYAGMRIAVAQTGPALLRHFNSPEMYSARRRAYQEATLWSCGDRYALVPYLNHNGPSWVSPVPADQDTVVSLSQVFAFVLEAKEFDDRGLLSWGARRMFQDRLSWFMPIAREMREHCDAYEALLRHENRTDAIVPYRLDAVENWMRWRLCLGKFARNRGDSRTPPEAAEHTPREIAAQSVLEPVAQTTPEPAAQTTPEGATGKTRKPGPRKVRTRFLGCSERDLSASSVVISTLGKPRRVKGDEHTVVDVFGVPDPRSFRQLWERLPTPAGDGPVGHRWDRTWLDDVCTRVAGGGWERSVRRIDRSEAEEIYRRLWSQGFEVKNTIEGSPLSRLFSVHSTSHPDAESTEGSERSKAEVGSAG